MNNLDALQVSRRRIFFNGMPDRMQQGIEVGPFTRPTVFPAEAMMFYADYYDTDELRRQAASAGIAPETVQEVHYILKDKDLHLQIAGQEFDFIIANHVLEHVIDPFRWMKDLEPALKPGGRFLITLPDKRFSFDKFRLDTRLAHFIEDYMRGGERSIKEHAIEASLYYDKGYVGSRNDAIERLSPEFLERPSNNYHAGMHVHVFQAEAFLDTVLRPFLAIGWLDLQLERFELNTNLGEFSFSLVKSKNKTSARAEDLFNIAYDSLPVRKVIFDARLQNE